MLQCVAVCCSVLQYVTVCYIVLQCVAACCSALHCVAAATCCSVLHCVAARRRPQIARKNPLMCRLHLRVFPILGHAPLNCCLCCICKCVHNLGISFDLEILPLFGNLPLICCWRTRPVFAAKCCICKCVLKLRMRPYFWCSYLPVVCWNAPLHALFANAFLI